MYHALCLKFALDLYHSRNQILLLHSSDNALNVAHVADTGGICLPVS
jgi:hypothetical protein